MKIRGKNITFHSERTDLDILRPAPASRFVPDWYRTMPGVMDGVETVKKCIPVLDSLTLGYMIPLTADVMYEPESKQILSNASFKINSDHMAVQTQDVVVPEEFDPQPHKWINSWHIKTPKGYSTLFIHPLNRLDLPFHSFSGVVDTDKHPIIINFPFVIRKDFSGIIPAGTPMIQAIPFKRDTWDSKVIDEKDSYFYEFANANQDAPLAWYKRNVWNKKTYR
jgi:hypothetical protein